MGRPPGQSDLHCESPNIDQEQDMVENGGSTRVAKVIFIVITVLVVALVLIVGIGLHVPRE